MTALLCRAAALAVLALLLASTGAASSGALRDFSSDGCSLFPDGDLRARTQWCDCCLAHDIAYWRGGTAAERERADAGLRECVLAGTGDRALAEMMFQGVRLGGHPAFPTWYRWGYGWDYGRGYKPLADGEQRTAAQKIERYWREFPTGYCPDEAAR